MEAQKYGLNKYLFIFGIFCYLSTVNAESVHKKDQNFCINIYIILLDNKYISIVNMDDFYTTTEVMDVESATVHIPETLHTFLNPLFVGDCVHQNVCCKY